MKNNKILLLALTLFVPGVSVLADSSSTNNGLSNQPGVDLSIQNIFGILQGIACWATRFVLIIMVGMIIWYGLLFMTSRGDPTKFTNAKKNLWYGIIGIIVILGAYTIISTVGNSIDSIGSSGVTAWNNYVPLDCSAY